MLLLTTAQSTHFQRIKSKVLTFLQALGLPLTTSPASFYTTLTLIKLIPAKLVCLLILNHTKHSIASGPLDLLFSLPGMILPQKSSRLAPSLPSGKKLKYHPINRLSLILYIKQLPS